VRYLQNIILTIKSILICIQALKADFNVTSSVPSIIIVLHLDYKELLILTSCSINYSVADVPNYATLTTDEFLSN